MNRYVTLALFLVLVVGGGALIGIWTGPGPWYEALIKPSFNPPGWLFAPVWTVLYIFIAIAGWRTWQRNRDGRAMKSWWVQLVLNFLWSPVFFTMEDPGAALVVIVVMLATILSFVALTWNRDRVAALLFVPYAAWVGFATMLNGAIWWLN